MFRTAYLVPRLVILLAFCLLLRLGLDPALKVGLQSLGGASLGARLDVERVNASLGRTSLYVEGVQVTDPANPQRNLVQFDGAWLKLSGSALLDRRLIVPYALVQGLQFDTPRERSGALDEASEPADDSLIEIYRQRLTAQAGAGAEDWLTDLEARLRGDIRSEFKSIPLAEELVVRWRSSADKIREDVKQWEQRIGDYRDLVESVRSNPLRHLEALDQRLADVQSLHTELGNSSRQLAQLRQQMLADREAIAAAKEHDLQRLQELARTENINPQALTEYLLGNELSGRLASITRWVKRGRMLVDYAISSPELNEETGRGIDFPFGLDRPGFLIQELAFSGYSSAAPAYTFAGRATGLTHEVHPDCEPTVIELTTNGLLAAQIRCEVDLSAERPQYRMVAKCPQLSQPAYELGDKQLLAIGVPASPVAVWLDVTLTGAELSGQVRWRQDALALQPQLAGEHGERLSAGLAAICEEVSSLHAVVELAGSLDRPSWQIHSNLGEQFSQGLTAAVERQLAQASDQLVAQLDTELTKHTAQLDNILDDRQQSLTKALESLSVIQRQLTEQWYGPLKRIGLSRTGDPR